MIYFFEYIYIFLNIYIYILYIYIYLSLCSIYTWKYWNLLFHFPLFVGVCYMCCVHSIYSIVNVICVNCVIRVILSLGVNKTPSNPCEPQSEIFEYLVF